MALSLSAKVLIFSVVIMPLVAYSAPIELVSGRITISGSRDFCVNVQEYPPGTIVLRQGYDVYLVFERPADGLVRVDGEVLDRFSRSTEFRKSRPSGVRAEGLHTIRVEVVSPATITQFQFNTRSAVMREVSCTNPPSTLQEVTAAQSGNSSVGLEARMAALERKVEEIEKKLTGTQQTPQSAFEGKVQEATKNVESLTQLVIRLLSDVREIKGSVEQLKGQPPK